MTIDELAWTQGRRRERSEKDGLWYTDTHWGKEQHSENRTSCLCCWFALSLWPSMAYFSSRTSRSVSKCFEQWAEIVFEVLSGFAQQWNAINWHDSQTAAWAWTNQHPTSLLSGISIIQPVARTFFIYNLLGCYAATICNGSQGEPVSRPEDSRLPDEKDPFWVGAPLRSVNVSAFESLRRWFTEPSALWMVEVDYYPKNMDDVSGPGFLLIISVLLHVLIGIILDVSCSWGRQQAIPFQVR